MALVVVSGAPCSGKSSYIRANKAEGDVVVDLDALAFALGADSYHSNGGNIRAVARAARAAVIDYAVGHGYNVWVIQTSQNEAQRRWYRAHNARFVELDPGYEECMRRAHAGKRPSWTIGAIERWYRERGKRAKAVESSRKW